MIVVKKLDTLILNGKYDHDEIIGILKKMNINEDISLDISHASCDIVSNLIYSISSIFGVEFAYDGMNTDSMILCLNIKKLISGQFKLSIGPSTHLKSFISRLQYEEKEDDMNE